MKVKELKSALKKDSLTDFFDPDVYGYAYAVYGGPWTIPFPRYNEVWIAQKLAY